ncbi:glycosyltransferase family 2 protein [Nodularia harveyana UHCC-0300]|uniref:Glycosyltransferase family 2 protein n=1 Tax=Nodularia harveyana UHCC-0300 TaxID=2974287 RepID=A0ABU5UCY4_9CYAN|nr:glycosyltransferase family 2 protein [Nodularia harveyana]MEA5581193.1 glycosyltransferase family 2 protein [Nodularia harveyana UHCC-0300]
MPANPWPEKDYYDKLDQLNSLLSEPSTDQEKTVVEVDPMSLPSRFKGRRRKAALVLTVVWSSTIALHLASWGSIFILGLTTVLGFHALVVVFARPRRYNKEMQGDFPSVSVLVAAKNEEAVISQLVKNLCSLKYPDGQYEVWIIDDNSTDQTPELLAELAQEYKQLQVFRRSSEASGGKSGALNQVLPLTKGEIVAVFDADAQVVPDLLLQVVPLFQREKVGAVQVRKAILQADARANTNAKRNFWIRGQMAEMALDTWFQQQRIAIGGIGELRGNGQFVRRIALESFGGWNEETITDDLDMTVRLHLDKWDIDATFFPCVQEEGVTNAIALWHQRSRWAEGGYQRYLDYWDLILKNRLGVRKTWDMLMFMFTMYILPTAAVPDLLMAVARHRLPILSPVTTLSVSMSVIGMFAGLKRIRPEQKFNLSTSFQLLLQTLRGTLYMLHWLVVISSTTARISFRPKRLKWVKTVHSGND